MASSSGSDNNLREALLSQLEHVQLEVNGRADLVGADETDPGTMDWWAVATIRIWTDSEPDDTEIPWRAAKDVALSIVDKAPGERELTILEANGLRVDLQEVLDVFDALDARSGDYANFIPMFADTRTLGFVDLVPELDEKLEGGGEVVIIDRVRLAPAWRQLGGVGRLLTARLLRWICTDPSVVAVNPFPIDIDVEQRLDATVFEPALEHVRRVWRWLSSRSPTTSGI